MTRTRGRHSYGRLEFYDGVTQERIRPLSSVYFDENFIGAYTVIPAAGSAESGCKWVKKIVGAAPPTVGVGADGANGLVECALTADSQKQSADCYMDDNRQILLTNSTIVEFVVNLSVLPTLVAECNWGLIGDWADGYDAITYSAFFTADGSGEIICEVDDNATNSSATSGITVVAGALHVYRIDFTDVTDVKFHIDGNAVATGTTFPYAATGANATLQPFFGCYKASGAGLGTLECENVRIWGNRS